jgi:hypothetical protein
MGDVQAIEPVLRDGSLGGTGQRDRIFELLPGAEAEKIQAAERLRRAGELVRAVSWLVQWLPDQLLDGFIADYLAEPEPSSSQLGNVVYSIALFRPQLLRPYADRLEQHVQRALLSGAPNELVDAFLDVWHQTHDLAQLEALALIRTDHAREQLRSAPECNRSMPFLVSLTGDLTPYGLLSLDGSLYGFWCDDCCVSSLTYQT